jgi:uracil-DNA glycosylase
VSPVEDLGDWSPLLAAQLDEPYWAGLQTFLAAERSAHEVFPPAEQVFAAFQRTPPTHVKVVILGQDPYHGPGQAHGLCFSVPAGVALPPSLRNIFKELQADQGTPAPRQGCLFSWADQGVLLLNTTLTVRSGEAGSHQGQGWEQFTDQVIVSVNSFADPVVFILWGAAARKKRAMIDQEHHHVIESTHPSPLSAYRGFFGSAPFSQANAALIAAGQSPIDWSLPSA